MNGKLTVPIVALVVFAVAFIGVGYALLESTVVVNNNTVDNDGLEVKLLSVGDSTGTNYLNNGGFSGSAKIGYTTTQSAGELKYNIPTQIIGTGDLVVKSVTSRTVTVTVDITGITMAGVTLSMKHGGSSANLVDGKFTWNLSLTGGEDKKETIELLVTGGSGLTDEPSITSVNYTVNIAVVSQ